MSCMDDVMALSTIMHVAEETEVGDVGKKRVWHMCCDVLFCPAEEASDTALGILTHEIWKFLSFSKMKEISSLRFADSTCSGSHNASW